MGLDINAVRFLIDARKRGVDFGEVITLGRQDLNVFPAKMVEVPMLSVISVGRVCMWYRKMARASA